ncbi:MAG: leucyl aminopeptidase [Parcubacteria group bacterium LiPW_15]|nr:MAG: leucyl aminopeptidase [Parcubacteria group bacterium LiPW_15]
MKDPAKLQFFFQPFSELTLDAKCPLLFVVFEEQADMIIGKRFPEVEEMRQRIDNITRKDDEQTVSIFSLMREEKAVPAGLVYIEYPWRRKRVKRSLDFGSINFYRKLLERTTAATGQLREMGFSEMTILLPGRFHPENLKNDSQREVLEMFVKTMVEAIVYANGTLDEFRSTPDPQITKVSFTYFGQYERVILNFFNRAIGAGEEMGEALVEVRRFTELPGNEAYPLKLASEFVGRTIAPLTSASPNWHKIHDHRFSANVKAALLYGAEGLAKRGFGLITAVGQGSKYEPCLLKLHYKPKKRSRPVKKLTLIGKGVTFDSGGVDLKGADSYDNMHHDMAGAATVVGVLKLADDLRLPVEIVALLPLVENTIGSKATRPYDIVRAYDGQTVEVRNTDAEGRLILADAIAYSEKNIRPNCTVTVATLCDMSDFAPDFLKVLVNDKDLERKVRLAEKRSNEKMLLFPPFEHFNGVSLAFVGGAADLKNDNSYYYHSGMVFLGEFFKWDPSPWVFVDVSEVFEKDAQEYAAGPGFGVRFTWNLVKQFA